MLFRRTRPRCSSRFCVQGLALMFAGVTCTMPAHAADLVTLRSGFTITCTTHRQVSPEVVRLYTSLDIPPGGAAANYMDVPLASVASIEVAAEAPSSATPNATAGAEPAPSLGALLRRSGEAHNVNAALLASVVRAESADNPRAVSRTGARGLMQLMPGTAAQLGVRDSFQPADNVDGGSAYLNQLLTRYHDNVALALAAYNAGPAAVDRYRGIPPFRETRLYVARVVREFNRLVRAEQASLASSTAAVVSTAAH